jgi:hypothetical protein
MSKFFPSQPTPRGVLPSALYLVEWAGLLTVLFIIAHLAGLREFTSVLNGTIGSTNVGWQIASWLGVAYVLIYLAWVIVVPILLLAALILKMYSKVAVTKGIDADSGAKAKTN